MDNIAYIIKSQEGRRLEFKGELPGNSDLAKTVIAFANDAGGDIYIGGNGGNNGGNGGNGGNKSLQIKEDIIKLIENNQTITIQEIANQIGISKRNCERIMTELKKSGTIRRNGSTRNGYWIIEKQ